MLDSKQESLGAIDTNLKVDGGIQYYLKFRDQIDKLENS